jgi:hypothetical protein
MSSEATQEEIDTHGSFDSGLPVRVFFCLTMEVTNLMCYGPEIALAEFLEEVGATSVWETS